MPTDLERFRLTQDHPHAGYADALAEIRAGGKQGHWIWYVLPQLYGLGVSSQARAYGIRGVEEAAAYLHDPALRDRLLEISTAVAEQLRNGVPLETLMGSSIDVLKLVSSLTLFGGVAKHLSRTDKDGAYESLSAVADEILSVADREGYPRCERTAKALEKDSAASRARGSRPATPQRSS